jgi:hypothetical protein
MSASAASELAQATSERIQADFLSGDHHAVIVNSPPGAGKSTLVVATAAQAATSARVPVVAQTNAQADDLVRDLATRHPDLEVGRLVGGATPPPEVADLPNVTVENKVGDLSACEVVIATAAKWMYLAGDEQFDAGIVDEAYQMRSDQLLYVGNLFERALFVGDPGQLDPFTPVDDTQWRGYADGPVNPAVATVLHNRPLSPVHQLPVSWRLSPTGAALVSDAFYPSVPFRSGSAPGERLLNLGDGAGTSIDAALDEAAATGWAFLELARRVAPPTDREAVATLAQLVIRLLQRTPTVTDHALVDAPLTAEKVAVGVVHRAQRSAVQFELERQADEAGIQVEDVVVDTANRLQGRQFEVVVVLHPLSGRGSTSEFHLETGRLCVLLSRHRHACIVVGRAGIRPLLDAHPSAAPVWIGAPIPIPDGWEANDVVLDRLQQHLVTV